MNLQALRPLFSVQRYLQNHHETTVVSTGRGRREWVIARGLCHYRTFSFNDIPSARWDEALTHKIRQWSPFSEYNTYIVWKNAQAQVWLWQRQQQQQAFEQAGIKQAICLPETVIRPRPEQDEARLIQSLTGVEGQFWQQGVLMASRWWLNMPNLSEWNNFLRARGLATVETVPTAIELPLLEKPWGKPRGRFSGTRLQQERLWILLSIAALILIFSWEAIHIWRWQSATTEVQTRIDALSLETTPILDARTQTLAAKTKIEQLSALNRYPSQLELIAQVAEKLPRNGAKLVEWFYQAGELRFTVESAAIDPRFYVEAFQSVPIFHDVKSETNNNPNQIVMSMKLK